MLPGISMNFAIITIRKFLIIQHTKIAQEHIYQFICVVVQSQNLPHQFGRTRSGPLYTPHGFPLSSLKFANSAAVPIICSSTSTPHHQSLPLAIYTNNLLLYHPILFSISLFRFVLNLSRNKCELERNISTTF